MGSGRSKIYVKFSLVITEADKLGSVDTLHCASDHFIVNSGVIAGSSRTSVACSLVITPYKRISIKSGFQKRTLHELFVQYSVVN
jgi:hypothetical protein